MNESVKFFEGKKSWIFEFLFVFSGALLGLGYIWDEIFWDIGYFGDYFFFLAIFMLFSLSFILYISMALLKYFIFVVISLFIASATATCGLAIISGTIVEMDFISMIVSLLIVLLIPFVILSHYRYRIKERDIFVAFSFLYPLLCVLTLSFFITFRDSHLYGYVDVLDSILDDLIVFSPPVLITPLISYPLCRKSLLHSKNSKIDRIISKLLRALKLKKSAEKSKLPEEEISPELQKLLKEKEEWRKKLDYLKNNKNELIKEGAMTEERYKERYEEIINKLVDIEDKIIQERMKGGVKK